MFIRIKATAKPNKKKVQICQTVRQGHTVKQVIVQHVGIAHDESELESLKKLARVLISKIREEREGPFLFSQEELEKITVSEGKSEMPQSPIQQEKIEVEEKAAPAEKKAGLIVDLEDMSEQQRVVEGFHEVFGHLFNFCGFHQILPKKKSEVLRELVLARIATPLSKMGTQSALANDFGVDIPLDRIYRMMDDLLDHEEEFQKAVFFNTQSLCFDEVHMAFFDVTTLYFESTEEDELRRFGYSKDQQFHSTQVVVALATTQDGLPIGYKTFPGNTAEVSTLLKCLDDWKKHISIAEVTVVADRAMMSEANLEALEAAEIKYVIAAKLKKLPKTIQQELFAKQGKEISLKEELHYVQEHELPKKRRLIVSYNEKRARKDKHDREVILEKVKQKIGSGKNAKKLVSNRGYQKYLKVEGEGRVLVDEEKLAQEQVWDGLHGIITNHKDKGAVELLECYRRQRVIEESFRICKTNLSIRPIYHFKPERVQAHILLCYLAFALMRYAEYRIKLQKKETSMEEIRRILWRTQSSILKDHKTGRRYRIPSRTQTAARDVYQTFGLIRNEKIQEIEPQ
jgi:transposase